MRSTTTTPQPNLTVPPGVLTSEFLTKLREGYVMNAADRVCHNAVTNNDLHAVALNREAVRQDDGHFSHRIKSKGITNQKNSGRCWMFATLNVLRPQVIRDHRMEEFEFSAAYLQFWDKLEKANIFLEALIELREVDYLDRDWELVNKFSVEDAGWWNYAARLLEKYGAVPQSVMPETHSSENTELLNEILGRQVRVWGVKMCNKHKEGGAEEEMRLIKEEALRELYRLLVLNFGVPPTEFEWRYRRAREGNGKNPDEEMSTPEQADLTPLERYTPQSFYQRYVSQPLADYVCLYHDPKHPRNRHYSIDRTQNVLGTEDMDFVNVEMSQIKEVAAASILANEPLWVAVNMEPDQSGEHGFMEHRLFDYETLFGVDLTISKADRARFYAGVSGHAMALMGVDLTDQGQPRKWLVENSWGTDQGKGKDGFFTIYDEWFDEHVYTIVAHKRHVSSDILARFEEEPARLPAWYPGLTRTDSPPNATRSSRGNLHARRQAPWPGDD